MAEVLQGPAANAVRELRWWKWNRAVWNSENHPNAGMRGIWKKEADRLRPPDIKDEDVERIINEGRDAYAQGKLSEWIATQTFGTRQHYFM